MAVKMLMFFTPLFRWEPHARVLEDSPEPGGPREARDAVTAFVHVESGDARDIAGTVTKAIKNIKWLAGKFGTRRVVLHYFAHLSADSSHPALARDLVEAMSGRLSRAGYEVVVTPYGWVNRLSMEVAGESLGRVFVDLASREPSKKEEA